MFGLINDGRKFCPAEYLPSAIWLWTFATRLLRNKIEIEKPSKDSMNNDVHVTTTSVQATGGSTYKDVLVRKVHDRERIRTGSEATDSRKLTSWSKVGK